jgi:hypothetical protein
MKKTLNILFLNLFLTLLSINISYAGYNGTVKLKIDGNEYGSLYPKDFLKINVQPGNRTLTIAGDLKAGVFGKTNINLELEAGESYYFVTGVASGKGLGILLGGVIGQAATGGAFYYPTGKQKWI